MVTVYGMSDKLGPIWVGTENNNPYDLELYGENIGDIIGDEVKKLIDTAYQKAQEILIQNRKTLDDLANALLSKEIITGEEFEKFFEV